MEIAKAYFCQAAKLNPNNIRALYGLLLVSCMIVLQYYIAIMKNMYISKYLYNFRQQIILRHRLNALHPKRRKQ